MTSAQVVETSVNVISNSPSQDYTHPDDRTSLNYDMTPGLTPFTILDSTFVEGIAEKQTKIPLWCNEVSITLKITLFTLKNLVSHVLLVSNTDAPVSRATEALVCEALV